MTCERRSPGCVMLKSSHAAISAAGKREQVEAPRRPLVQEQDDERRADGSGEAHSEVAVGLLACSSRRRASAPPSVAHGNSTGNASREDHPESSPVSTPERSARPAGRGGPNARAILGYVWISAVSCSPTDPAQQRVLPELACIHAREPSACPGRAWRARPCRQRWAQAPWSSFRGRVGTRLPTSRSFVVPSSRRRSAEGLSLCLGGKDRLGGLADEAKPRRSRCWKARAIASLKVQR